ncbi:MAG: uroporphyrinogen-III C-methyltransferase [Planctomycetota bacterium]
MRAKAKTVYLAGAGPGDPGLLTVRTRELLSICECVIYDALVSPEIMALVNPAAEQIYVGKRGNRHALEQAEINQLLVKKAATGKSVLRLKGGDPYLFGRGAEEALFLVEHGTCVEVIPGITAGIAAPTYAGIPVTHRKVASAVVFVTGHEDSAKSESALDWAALAKIGTLCFYMSAKNISHISDMLSKHLSPETPVAVIQWGATPRQRTVIGTLQTIAQIVKDAKITAPALTVVGAVVRYRDQLNFFERTPLFGKRVLVTRARAQAGSLAESLRELGATAYEFPTIRILPAKGQELKQAVKRLARAQYDWLIFTSANGVDAVFDEISRQRLDARAVRAKVAVIGSATAARLLEKGLRADLISPKFVAESIVETLKKQNAIDGQRFLLARADIARGELPAALTKLGGLVSDIVAYRTALETTNQTAALATLAAGEIDAVTFTSASTVRNFAEILGPDRLKTALAAPRLRCFSIGPKTSDAMRQAGIPIQSEATTHNILGLLQLLTTFHF